MTEWARTPVEVQVTPAPVKLLLRNNQSPGDVVMLTAAVRDLHRTFPGQFITDVRTTCLPLWEHNPHITHIADDDPAARHIECHYPLINTCNDGTHHFIHGFTQHLGEQLGLRIEPSFFRVDIHLA